MDKSAVTRPRRRACSRVGSVCDKKSRRVGRSSGTDGGVVGHGGSVRFRWLVFGFVESAVAAKESRLAIWLVRVMVEVSSTF